MSRATLARGIALALGCALLVAGAVLAVYDLDGAVVTFALLAALGIATVARDRDAARPPRAPRQPAPPGARSSRRWPSVRSRVALALFVQLMFVSAHDALLTAAVGTYSALLGLWAARLLSHRVMDDVDTLRAGPRWRSAPASARSHLELGGDDELAQVGREVEAMVARLAAAEARARRRTPRGAR